MSAESKKIMLSDLIDIQFLQKLQDNFAETIGVASLTIDDNGPITKPSKFTDFCSKFIRANELGSERCNQCDIEGGKLAMDKGEPLIYECHTGLMHFVVPIIVAGQHIASILGGQFSTKTPDEEHFKEIADELGIKDKKNYIEDLRKIRIIPEEKVKAAAQLLFLVANAISDIAHKNYELIKKDTREELTRKIIEKIRSTLEPREIKKYFVETICNYFNADRCLFVDYDKSTNKFVPFEIETLKSNEMTSILGVNLEEEFPEFCAKLKRGKNIVIKDLEKTLSRKNFLKYKSIETLERSGAKSDYGLLVKYGDEIMGIMIMHFLTKKNVLAHDEFDFLKVIRDQAGTALHQASLYQIMKNQAEREIILRSIIKKMRNSLDIKQIQHEIVNEIGMFFNADGVRIADYDEKNRNYIVSEESEYRSSDKIKSWVGVSFKDIPQFNEKIMDVHLSGNDIIFRDIEEYLDENHLRGDDIENFYREFGFVSSVATNIYHKDVYVGNFVITFGHKRDFSNAEIKFLKTLADQAGTAFYQAKLYAQEKLTAEKEKVLRDITNKIRSSLDIEEIKEGIVNQIGKLFNADRVSIAYYDYNINNYLITTKGEYRASDNVKTFVGIDFTGTPGFAEYIRDTHFKGKDIIFNDLECYLQENKLKTTSIEKFYKEFGFISSAAINIYYEDIFLGDLVVTFENQRDFSEDEISFLKIIADQSGVALHQAELYLTTKQLAEREILLRQSIETIRSSIDIDDIENKFVTELGKRLDADRVFISRVHKNNGSFVPFLETSEYLSSPDVKSSAHIEVEKLKGYSDIFRNNGVIKFSKREDFIDEYKDKIDQNFLYEYDIKSGFAMPILYVNDVYGVLVIHYTKKKHYFTDNEINLIKILADQTGIALYQAKLYKTIKSQAERESLLRNITEKIRSSLNIDEILSFICEETAKVFDIQRVAIPNYPDTKNFEKFIIRKEYAAASDIKLYPNSEDASKTAAFWGERLFKSQEVITFDDIEKLDLPDYFKRVYSSIGVKSNMGISIRKGDDVWGSVILSECRNARYWTSEEKDLLKAIANQIYIAINQAELYEKEKIAAERERISRNIIEILRSSIDKAVIKKLFVKNLGKFFIADRVFFSDYDPKIRMYLPVEEGSEYLSNPEEKSFVGYDWSNPDIKEHVQILLEKREIKIPDWAEYIRQNPNMSQGLQFLYVDSNVQSSYNFPVLYQDRIMGYFCIEFTRAVCKLSDEDINRIRSICSQAGIALYHAQIYMKAQAAIRSRREAVGKFSNGIKIPVDNIISSCNQLLELTKDISNSSD